MAWLAWKTLDSVTAMYTLLITQRITPRAFWQPLGLWVTSSGFPQSRCWGRCGAWCVTSPPTLRQYYKIIIAYAPALVMATEPPSAAVLLRVASWSAAGLGGTGSLQFCVCETQESSGYRAFMKCLLFNRASLSFLHTSLHLITHQE